MIVPAQTPPTISTVPADSSDAASGDLVIPSPMLVGVTSPQTIAPLPLAVTTRSPITSSFPVDAASIPLVGAVSASAANMVIPSEESLTMAEVATATPIDQVMQLSEDGSLVAAPAHLTSSASTSATLTKQTSTDSNELPAAALPQIGTTAVGDLAPIGQTTAPVLPALPDEMQSALPLPAATPPSAPSPQPTPPPIADQSSGKQYANLVDVLVSEFGLDSSLGEKILLDNITTGAPVETLLTKDNVVSEVQLTKAKAKLNQVPYIDLSDVGIYPEALNKLPEGVARNYKMLPFAIDVSAGTLSVAMVNPLDLSAVDFAQQKTGMRIAAHYAPPSEIERLMAEYYSQSLSSEVTAALEQTTDDGKGRKKSQKTYADLSKETIRQAPISKIVETILTFAIKARASDIHVEPLDDHTRVRYRIDGILTEKLILPRSVHEAVVSRIKILSDLKIDEKRVPQDGRFNFSALDQEVDLRISTLPTIHGEKIVMRLLKKDQKVPTMPQLGLDGLALRQVQDAVKVPHGIILITGPTGSGKTTTLYSLLHVINSPKVNIVTLEDPVEYQIGGINQVQINPQAGLTFASGLRSFLRQDPNVIMVGEIRDSETAELAIQASLTGHLVFSTLHTSSAAGALPRLIDMGAEPFLLASSMTLVMAQRVMRVLNSDYTEEYTPEKAVIDDIKTVLGNRFEVWCKQVGKDPNAITLRRPTAKRPQTEPEYKGRIAIFEVMKITEEISRMILERKPASEMEKLALRDGMLLMKQDGYLKALSGITTIEEVLRVAQI